MELKSYKDVKPDVTARQVWSYIFTTIKPFSLSILSMFLAVFAYSMSVTLNPYLLKVILNRVAQGSSNTIFSYLAAPIAAYLGICFLLIVTYRLYNYLVSIEMIPRMREKIARHCFELLLNKNYSYFQNNFSGSLTSKINDLTSSVPDFIQVVIDRLFRHILTIGIATVVLWQVNIRFALFMLVSNIVGISVVLLRRKTLTYLGDNWSEFGSIITGKIVDVLSNILSVRLFTARNVEKQSLTQTLRGAVNAEQKMQWAYLWVWLWYSVCAVILQVLNFYFLCKGRQEGWITVGDFALVLSINFSILEFMWFIAEDIARFSTLYGCITQALRAILEKPEIEDKRGARELLVSQGNITFQDVTFQYKGTESLFQHKTVTIEAGQKVGLVGYSGGGKSTFVNLILRLYEVTDGHIFIDGQDIREVTQDSLRNNIAMIPQDPSLFHRSLMDNIRYGRINATDQEAIEAAKKAHADEFIAKLPSGYDSLVGERGVKLSGGQRQRIAIARAILKNAPILILDEATSQLDSVTESYIQESLWELMQNKTTIVIAHRLSTLLHMDRILVFDQGKIVEDGTHSELLALGGLYKTLWDAQVGGFLPDKKE